MPSNNYGNQVFWEKKYKEAPTQRFDWLFSYETIKPIITYLAEKDHKILYAGCGNSMLSQQMCTDGYRDITNIDFSKEVIRQALQRKSGNPPKSGVSVKSQKEGASGMVYKCVDVTTMDSVFDENQFDIVLDKCLLDAIVCNEDALKKTLASLRQIERVLKVGGKYICFSIGAPKNRRFYMRNRLVKFNVEYFPVSKFQQFKNWTADGARRIEMEETVANSKIDPNGIVKNVYCYVCTKVVETVQEEKGGKKKGKNKVHYDKEDEMHEMPMEEEDGQQKEEVQQYKNSQKDKKQEVEEGNEQKDDPQDAENDMQGEQEYEAGQEDRQEKDEEEKQQQQTHQYGQEEFADDS